MPTRSHSMRAILWLVAKDLLAEFRLRRVWPSMLLLGVVLVLLLEMQTHLPAALKLQVVCGLLWLSVFFAGTFALERSFAGEREEGCWETLLLYPVSPSVIFLAKLVVNMVAIGLLECVLVPAFVILGNIPLLDRPGPLVLVAVLGNIGFAAVGVLVSALTTAFGQRGSLLSLLVLPLLTPILLAAAEATRLSVLGNLGGAWSRWVQLLAAFAVVFVTIGLLVFEFVIED